jgi:hypothetical protein
MTSRKATRYFHTWTLSVVSRSYNLRTAEAERSGIMTVECMRWKAAACNDEGSVTAARKTLGILGGARAKSDKCLPPLFGNSLSPGPESEYSTARISKRRHSSPSVLDFLSTPLPHQHLPFPLPSRQQPIHTPRSTCASSASTPPPPCPSWLPCDGLTSTVCAYACQRHRTPF